MSQWRSKRRFSAKADWKLVIVSQKNPFINKKTRQKVQTHSRFRSLTS